MDTRGAARPHVELFSQTFDPDAPVDTGRLRDYRKRRIRDALEKHDLAAVLLFNPINIRYASDARNMQVYGLHNPCRYLFMAADGHAVLFDFRNCEHLSQRLATINEIRPAKAWYHMVAGTNADGSARMFAREIADLVRVHGGNNVRVAYDRIDPMGAAALMREALIPVDGLPMLDSARVIKSADEITAMCDAIRACEEGMRRMQAAHRPGITEQALWSILCHANAELGGEWMETRLLSAGQRTNPWYNECGDYVIQSGDLVSFDTDLVGRHGYAVDLSRSWLTGDAPPTDAQRRLYAMAHAQIRHNVQTLRPGRTFRQIADAAYKIPDRFAPRMNRAIAHGIGLCNEYPLIVNSEYFAGAYDGVVEEGMVLCVESYVGEPGVGEGVKLEEQVLITASGAKVLSSFPFEEQLL